MWPIVRVLYSEVLEVFKSPYPIDITICCLAFKILERQHGVLSVL